MRILQPHPTPPHRNPPQPPRPNPPRPPNAQGWHSTPAPARPSCPLQDTAAVLCALRVPAGLGAGGAMGDRNTLPVVVCLAGGALWRAVRSWHVRLKEGGGSRWMRLGGLPQSSSTAVRKGSAVMLARRVALPWEPWPLISQRARWFCPSAVLPRLGTLLLPREHGHWQDAATRGWEQRGSARRRGAEGQGV